MVLPFLMLVPWWLMKWELFHEFTLFETFRAKANIITGLLGFVNTINGGYQEALSIAHIDASTSLWSWGAGQFRSNFFGIAGAVAIRLWKVFTFEPLLSALALGSLFISRHDQKVRALFYFLFYFAAIHLLLPVEDRYFIPLLPVLSVLIARSAVLLCGGCPNGKTAAGRYAAYASYLLAGLLACGPLALYAHTRIYSANIKARDEAAVLRRETAAFPGDAWLLERNNELSLREYRPIDYAKTEEHLKERGAGRLRFQYALNAIINKQQAPRTEFMEKPDPELAGRLPPLIFLHDLEKRDRAAARAKFGEYINSCRTHQAARFRGRDVKAEKASFDNYKERSGDICPEEFAAAAGGLLEYYPPKRALLLAREICGERLFASRLLLPLALYWQNAKRYRNSLELLDLLLQDDPDNAELWSDKGMQELFLGMRQAAIGDFRRSIRSAPDFIPAYISLGSVLEMAAGGTAAAKETYGLALARLTPRYGSLRPLLLERTSRAP